MLDSNELRDKNISPLEETETLLWSPEINDEEYIADLRKLKELRSFLIEQAEQLRGKGESEKLSFARLNLLRISRVAAVPLKKNGMR